MARGQEPTTDDEREQAREEIRILVDELREDLQGDLDAPTSDGGE